MRNLRASHPLIERQRQKNEMPQRDPTQVALISQDLKQISTDLALVNHFYLGMRLRSEVETFPNAPTTPLVKPIGHGNARAAKYREMLLESKQDQKQHLLDASTALETRDSARIR